MMIEGMGHDLPRAAWPQLIDAIASHSLRADERPNANGHPPLPTRPPSLSGL
jgi:hypothetical protein